MEDVLCSGVGCGGCGGGFALLEAIDGLQIVGKSNDVARKDEEQSDDLQYASVPSV
jgi:hypothetical protein